MTTRRSEAVLYAEHNQFYVVDPDTSAADDDAGDFDNASFEDRVAVRPGMLTVFTATYGYVRVILERHEERPPDDIGRYDHIVEAPFEAASGRIAALETDVSRTIALDAGERFRYFLDVVRQSGWLSELEDAMSPVTWQDEGRPRLHPRVAAPALRGALRRGRGARQPSGRVRARRLAGNRRDRLRVRRRLSSLRVRSRVDVATPDLAAQLRR